MSGQFALPDRLKGPGGRELIAVRGSTRSCKIDRCHYPGYSGSLGVRQWNAAAGGGDHLVMLFGVEIGVFKERMTFLPCFPSPNPSRLSTTAYLTWVDTSGIRLNKIGGIARMNEGRMEN
jgi:hypothetical protein